MSAIVQQEDAADSGKDEDKSVVTTATSGDSGNDSGDGPSAHINDDLTSNALKTVEQPESTIDTTEDILKPMSPEKMSIDISEEETLDEIAKYVAESKMVSDTPIPSGKPSDSNEIQNNAIQREGAAIDSLDNTEIVANVIDSQTGNKNLDVPKLVVDTGYKETSIDDVSDSEFELHWTDDEEDVELNVEPLSEEALKKLDIELGIGDADIAEKVITDTTAISPKEFDKKKIFTDDKSLETVTLAQKLIDSNLSEVVQTATTETQSLMEINNPQVIVDDDSKVRKTESNVAINVVQKLDITDKEVGTTNNVIEMEDKQISQNNELELHPIKPVESGSGSINTEPERESNLDPANEIVTEIEKAMDVDISSVQSMLSMSESNKASDITEPDQPSNSVNSTQLVNKMDVDEVDKINEIDIDETIVDLKNLIDQDEDTIKQLGLDVGKADNKNNSKDENEQKVKNIDKETKTSEDESESVKVDLESATIKTTNKSIKDDVKPMYDDILTDTENVSSCSVTKTALGTDLGEKLSVQNADISESVLIAESKDDETINNANNTLENVSKIVTHEIDIGNEDSKTSKQNSENIEKTDTMKDISQKSEDKSDIQLEVDRIDKDDSKTDKKLTTEVPFDQKLENNDKVTSHLIKQTDAVVEKNIDDSTSLKESSELDTDKSTINVLKVTKKDILKDSDEFITPDITNESIKINTDHRINRPDVMLDIPTREFDFDDFDETLPTQSGKIDENESDMTTKTVTEIVNQLAKETENMETDEIKNADINSSSIKDNNITQNENQSEVTVRDVEMPLIEIISKTTEKEEADTGKSGKVEDKTVATQNDDKSPKEGLKSIENIDELEKTEQKSTESSEKKSKSTENEEKSPKIDSQPSTSKVTSNNISITPQEDKKLELGLKSSEKAPKDIEPQPSTSEGVTGEAEEVTDSLGLLAESSRVMDDDDDEEQEPDDEEADDGDGEDDDEFDPDDEESSNPTGEHSEESNPPHSELDIQEEGIDIEFHNEAFKIGLDSNDATFGIMKTEIIEEPEEKDEDSTAGGPVRSADGAKPKERRSSILADLLTKPAADMNVVTPEDAAKLDKSKTSELPKATNDASVVDLGEISSEDDAQTKKDSAHEAPSVAQAVEEDKDKKEPPVTADGDAKPKDDKEKSKSGEVFSLDSDDEDKADKMDVSYVGAPRDHNKCINYSCVSDDSVAYYLADRMAIAYYGAAKRRKRAVCQNCLDVVNSRNEGLVCGIKDLRPLMALRMSRPKQTLLEISDSDSEGEEEPLGEEGAKHLEDKLTDMLNEAWVKYNMDDRLKATEEYLETELKKMQKQSEEVDQLLRDCQKATDQLRVEFYSSFEGPRHELPSISIHDTPIASYSCLEEEEEYKLSQYSVSLRTSKRLASSAADSPAKKQALMHDGKKASGDRGCVEDDKDISVVRLSAEVAPADLPPPGELVKPTLKVGLQVYAMKNQYGAWLRGRVMELQPKTTEAQYTVCRIRFDHKVKNPTKMLTARSVACTEPSEVRMTIGTRMIALFKNSENSLKRGEFYYSGVVAEIPNPVNGYRYLVFFDDGYAQYVEHRHTRLVFECKTLVWEEVHPFSRDFVCNYLMKYPERPMVRMHPGQEVNVEWNGKWWDTKVIKVDAALVHVQFPDNRTEWIYRGSTRLKPLFAELLAAKRAGPARLPRSTKANTKTNVPYVEYTRSDDPAKADTQTPEDLRRQRSVAKKSTTIAQQISNAATDGIISRVVFYTPKNSVRPLKMVTHTCGPQCQRSDLLSLQDLRTYNPLTKPLLSGWERQIVRHKSSRGVMYRAPCGRRLRCMRELHRYLRTVRSDMPVDLFDFNPSTHCLAEFVLNKSNVQKKDLSHGKENVPVPCVNYYDHSLPEFCLYQTERTPTSGVPLNLDPEFLCGCDCKDDCQDKTKCACWKMTLEGAKTIGLEGPNIGYNYRRLPEPLPSGIYECNSRCKCNSTCLNRVAQNPLQLKLQIFKTLNRGWGIRALNDVPKGAFICIYAGNLLTDATANLDGINEGDEYLAELDYIEVVESMKEGYEDDVPEADKKLDKNAAHKSESDPESETSESEDEGARDKTDTQDGDFQPGYLSFGLAEFNKRLRRRDKKKNKEEEEEEKKEPANDDKSNAKPIKKEEGEEFITISDDEEVRVSQREPVRFAAEESMTDNKHVSKYRSIRSHYGKDEACYIMDAKVQGNIGRYLNHSCSPNVFVQNVFVDTHDPRFPWVSFFALHHIRAGTELTWNYNYDIGSVPGKVLYCYCGAPNCRGRLL